MSDVPEANRYSTIIRRRSYGAFFLSQCLTNLSDGLLAVTIIYFVVELGGSPLQLGIVTFGVTLSRGLLGPIGGLVGDRMNRRGYLVFIEVLRAGLMLALWLLAAAQQLNIVLLMIFGIAVSTLFAISVPVAKSLIPHLVTREQLQAGNALIQTITWPAFFLGSGLLAPVLKYDLAWAAFPFMALAFGVSAVLLMFLPSVEAPPRNTEGKWSDDFRSAYRELSSNRVLVVRVWTYAAFTFFWRGALQIALPLLVLRQLDSPSWLYGFLMFINGVGEFVGNIIVGRLKLRRPLVFSFLCEFVLGLGLVFLALSLFIPYVIPLLVCGALLIGLGAATIDIPLLTVMQRQVSENNIGKAISYWFTIGSCGGALGSVAVGGLFELVSVPAGTVAFALVVTATGLGLWIWASSNTPRGEGADEASSRT